MFALQVVLTAAFLYGLYWVIRKAVAAGRLDAQRKLEQVNGTPGSPAHTTRG